MEETVSTACSFLERDVRIWSVICRKMMRNVTSMWSSWSVWDVTCTS